MKTFIPKSKPRGEIILSLLVFLVLIGCNSMSQKSDVALIREPGNRTYSDPEPIAVSAHTLWEYAVLSDNVYLSSSMAQIAEAEGDKACSLERHERLELKGWQRWQDVPNPEL